MVGQLQPVEGTVSRRSGLSIGRYHQHSAEVLDLSKSPVDYLKVRSFILRYTHALLSVCMRSFYVFVFFASCFLFCNIKSIIVYVCSVYVLPLCLQVCLYVYLPGIFVCSFCKMS